MNTIKMIIALALSVAMVFTLLISTMNFSVSAAYDHVYTYAITGYDKALPTSAHDGIYIFTNATNGFKQYLSDAYALSASRFLIFDGNGKLVEAGENIGTGASALQIDIQIPAGGFAVAFGANADTTLQTCYTNAIEDALIDHETVHVAYDAKASYNKTTNKLTLEYSDPVAPSANAKKFLFVGNSGTYVNNNPLKFKAIAAAAGIEVDISQCTWGGAKLKQYADSTEYFKNGLFMQKIKEDTYDYVVLQDNATSTHEETRAGVAGLKPIIQQYGAETVLYMRNAYDQDFATREATAYRLHSTFMQLAREFDIDKIAYAADAHMICATKYPEINLFANDKAHQSVEGSYLFALVYAVSYLGIDVMGNSYTAGLDTETARKLQECAMLGCTEGYGFEQLLYTENGQRYPNIAWGKEYTCDAGEPYTGNEIYSDVDGNGRIQYKLTDSGFALSGDDRAVGAYVGKSVDIIIDLGGEHIIKAIRTDLYGGTWGIATPDNYAVAVAISKDGSNWTQLGNAEKSAEKAIGTDWKQRMFNLATNSDETTAKYVKVTYSNVDATVAKSTFWTSDIQVYGKKVNQSSDTLENLALNQSYTTTHNADAGFPDSDSKELTDGTIVTNANISAPYYADSRWAGFNISRAENRNFDIIMPIGDGVNASQLYKVAVNVGTKGCTAGVYEPNLTVYYSVDGEDWLLFGAYSYRDYEQQIDPALMVNIDKDTPVEANFIKINVSHPEYNLMWLGEIQAWGIRGVEGDDEPSDPSDDPSTSEHPSVSEDPSTSDDPSTSEDPSTSDPSTSDPSTSDPSNPDDPGVPVDPPVDPDAPIKGDINENGEIDSMDYVYLRRAYFGTYKLKDVAIGDINGKDGIDSMDYVLLKRAYFGTYSIK